MNSKILLCLAIAAAIGFGFYQHLSIRALESELQSQHRQQQALETQNEQLERNLRSAGLQLGNVAAALQEANARASACQPMDEQDL